MTHAKSSWLVLCVVVGCGGSGAVDPNGAPPNGGGTVDATADLGSDPSSPGGGLDLGAHSTAGDLATPPAHPDMATLPPPPPTKKVLNVSWQGQETYYW
jgi:hypothetical protein